MKTFKQVISEVQEPIEGVAKKMKEVGTKEGEALKNDIATDAQFKGTTSKKPRKADKSTGDGKTLPESVSPAQRVMDIVAARESALEEEVNTDADELTETFKAGSMKLKDGSTVKLTTEQAKSLNSLFSDLNKANKSKMEAKLNDTKSSFDEIVKFAQEI